MDTKLINKIKKLLALSESSNEHEAQLSLLKAQELLVKHKLSLKEVKEYKNYNAQIKDRKTIISFTKSKWKANLARVIADNFGCYHYFKTRYVHTITFFGREEDIEVCNIVLEYAVDCIESAIKRMRYQYSRDGYGTKGVANDYAIGFIAGLKQKLEEQMKANQEWGLVLVKDKEVVDAYDKKTFKRTINTNTQFQGNSDAYRKGSEDGKKFSISDKIAEGESGEILEIAGANV